ADHKAGARVTCPDCNQPLVVPELIPEAIPVGEKRVSRPPRRPSPYYSGVTKTHLRHAEDQLLYEDEEIRAAACEIVKHRPKSASGSVFASGFIAEAATHKGGLGKHYLILTDLRILAWARGLLSSSTDMLALADIQAVEKQTIWGAAALILSSAGKEIIFQL